MAEYAEGIRFLRLLNQKEKNMYKTFSLELAGRTLSVDIGRVGKQANGCAFMHYGDTTVLSTATASEKPREGSGGAIFHTCSYSEDLLNPTFEG